MIGRSSVNRQTAIQCTQVTFPLPTGLRRGPSPNFLYSLHSPEHVYKLLITIRKMTCQSLCIYLSLEVPCLQNAQHPMGIRMDSTDEVVQMVVLFNTHSSMEECYSKLSMEFILSILGVRKRPSTKCVRIF